MLILYLVSKMWNTKFKLLNNFFKSALSFVNLVLKSGILFWRYAHIFYKIGILI